MTTENTPPQTDELTQYRLGMIEDTLKAMRENLVQLTSLELKHIETREALERAFVAIKDNDDRMRVIEVEMPTLKMIRGWVIAGVVGCAALLGITLFKIATMTPIH